MRHRADIEADAAAYADKPVLTNFEVAQVERLVLETLLDIRKVLTRTHPYIHSPDLVITSADGLQLKPCVVCYQEEQHENHL